MDDGVEGRRDVEGDVPVDDLHDGRLDGAEVVDVGGVGDDGVGQRPLLEALRLVRLVEVVQRGGVVLEQLWEQVKLLTQWPLELGTLRLPRAELTSTRGLWRKI